MRKLLNALLFIWSYGSELMSLPLCLVLLRSEKALIGSVDFEDKEIGQLKVSCQLPCDDDD